jgi:hypothetical protein
MFKAIKKFKIINIKCLTKSWNLIKINNKEMIFLYIFKQNKKLKLKLIWQPTTTSKTTKTKNINQKKNENKRNKNQAIHLVI